MALINLSIYQTSIVLQDIQETAYLFVEKCIRHAYFNEMLCKRVKEQSLHFTSYGI